MCSHFNIEKEEKHVWYSMLHYFKKGKNIIETQKKIDAVYENFMWKYGKDFLLYIYGSCYLVYTYLELVILLNDLKLLSE